MQKVADDIYNVGLKYYDNYITTVLGKSHPELKISDLVGAIAIYNEGSRRQKEIKLKLNLL